MATKFLDDNGLLYFWQKIVNKITGNIVNDLTSSAADKSLSAAQGKVLDEKIKAINTNMGNLGGGDMLKSAYDTNNDGKVDKANAADTAGDAEKLGGQLPEYYAKKAELFSGSYNDLSDKPTDFAPTEHTHEISEVNGLQDELDDMVAVAQGKCSSYVFDTVEGLDTWLSDSENTEKLKTGDVFYIRAVEVPDYWWDADTSSKQILETTKVDLTTITNAEIDTIVAS